MLYHITKAQDLSEMCLVCGEDNHAGLHGQFLETEEKVLIGIFDVRDEHQSYPERTHGGISCAILDELIGRVIWLQDDSIWGVTATIEVKYRKPVPLDRKIKGRAQLIENRNRLYTAHGEILLEDGTVAVEATGHYMKLPVEKIVENVHVADSMRADTRPYPATIEL